MIGLIAYAVGAALIAAFVYMAWSGFTDAIGRPYAEAQRKADQAIIAKAESAQRQAETERDNAKSDSAQCAATSNKQSKEVDRLSKMSADNIRSAREARAKADREAAAIAPKIADLQAKAAAAPQLATCEVELGKAKTVMREHLRSRREPPQ